MAGPAIYEVIAANLDQVGRLTDPDLRLPDEPAAEDGIRWAPGALDGVMSHHAVGSSDNKANDVSAAFVAACKKSSRRRLRRLYDAVKDDSVLDYLDATIERLVELQPDRDRLHELGGWLATTAHARGAVKVGLAVLGVTGLQGDRAGVGVVRALGAHEEFTLFAAVALTNGLEEPESELWALATSVDGWGRIQCVERLRGTTDPEIRSWILRQGFRNSIMYEYLAHVAATTGGLLAALREGPPDRELLTAAGDIIGALCVGGPAEDMSDYDDGADAVEAYLTWMSTRAETLRDFDSVSTIADFLDSEDWDALTQVGWTATRREAFEDACSGILGRESWVPLIYAGLDSEDGSEYWLAEKAARRQGLDIFDIQVARLRREPLGSGWFNAWRGADTRRATALAALAREILPLDSIATGPGDAMGLGPGWEAHQALDWTLQELRHHPGVGADLVFVGLRSPVTRNRNMSLNCLQDWPREQWPDGAADLAAGLAVGDPNEQTRTFAAEVLAAETPHQ